MASAYFVACVSGRHQQLSCFVPVLQRSPGPTARSQGTPPDASFLLSSCYSLLFSLFPSLCPFFLPTPSSFLLLVFLSPGGTPFFQGEASEHSDMRLWLGGGREGALPLTGLVSLSFTFFICNMGTIDGAIHRARNTNLEHYKHSVHGR